MAAEMEKSEALMTIKEVFEKDQYGDDDKLLAVQKLKNIFKPPDEVYSKLRLESLLATAGFSLKCKILDKDFLFGYGTALVANAGMEPALDSELLAQLEYVLVELNKLDESKADVVCTMLWRQMEGKSIVYFSDALCASKQALERIMLDWMETDGDPRLDFPAKVAASSPQLFQILTAILYEILVTSHGHPRVLKVTEFFIHTVTAICKREGKDFLGLYPRDCRRLVVLLMVVPEAFGKQENLFNQVNSLLSEMFLRERRKAMILLSHYPSWVHPFKEYLKETGVIC